MSSVRPNAAARDLIRRHALEVVRNNEAKSGYTRSSGVIKIMDALISSMEGVASANLATPGGVRLKRAQG